MKRKFLIFLTALTAVFSSVCAVPAYAAPETELTTKANAVAETTDSKETTDTDDKDEENETTETTATDGEDDNEAEGKKASLKELYVLLEKSGYSIDDINEMAKLLSDKKEDEKKLPYDEPDNNPNGYLIERVTRGSKDRDFMSITTRDGHVFYLVIDYEDENKRVYFLNAVDTADLRRLLADSSDANLIGTEQSNTNISNDNNSNAPTPPAENEVKRTDVPSQKGLLGKNTILYIVGGVIIVGIAVVYATKKKNVRKSSYDDDSDSGDTPDFIEEEEEPEMFTDEEGDL